MSDFSSREKLKLETRSRSVPDICLTPRSKKKLLQIEHPHFDNADISSDKSGTDISETVKSDSERNSSDFDEVFSADESSQGKTTYNSPRRDENSRVDCMEGCKNDMELVSLDSKANPHAGGDGTKATNGVKSRKLEAELKNNEVRTKQIGKKDFKGSLIDQNANQWKATTLV